MTQGNELPRRRPGASRHQPDPAATAIREEPLLAALRKMWQGKYAIESATRHTPPSASGMPRSSPPAPCTSYAKRSGAMPSAGTVNVGSRT